MAAKPKFEVGMGSSAKVLSKGNFEALERNDVDTGYKVSFVPYEKLVPNKLNKDFPQSDIEMVMYSILDRGLDAPLKAIYDSDNDIYRITSGEQRYRALGMMGEEKRNQMFPKGIPCKPVSGIKDEIDEEIDIIGSNIDTRNYTPEERSKHIRRLAELLEIKRQRGEIKSVTKELMERHNITERMARKYIATNRMIPELKEILNNGGINLDDSEKFAAMSEESQKQILELINSQGGVSKEELVALKRIEGEKKVLEAEAEQAKKELAEKDDMITYLQKQINEIAQQQEEQKEQTKKEKIDVDKKDSDDSLKDEIKRLNDLLNKETAAKKRVQTNFDNLQIQMKENAERNINLSKEDLKHVADIAKVENLHSSIYDQLKQLEKLENVIRKDKDLKIKLKVVAERLLKLVE